MFDENMPWRVAVALRALRLNASYVGNEEHLQPARGSTDPEVLAHAVKTNQTIVTINHDMVLLCAESNESAIWIDQRRRQIQRTEMARLCLDNVAAWESIIRSSNGPLCIQQMRTTRYVLTVEAAAKRVRERIRRRKYREAASRRRELGPLADNW